MSMTKCRTWQKHHVGYLHLTVEAEPVVVARNLDRHRGLSKVISELIELLDDGRLSATWAVGDPAHSAVTELVAVSGVEHELALLGDVDWLGPTAGRTRFARELARRVGQARAAGIDLITFVPRVAPINEHVDLVVKQELRAVVSAVGATSRPLRTSGPHAMHYGVWEFSANERLPLESSWRAGSDWKLRRRISRAAADADAFHLIIDAAAVERQGRSAISAIARLMRHAAKLRDRGLVQVETLGAAAARLSHLPAAIPQRSILRAA